jgi:CO/xanthine dehydrogenase Mo-binding subunit
MATSFEDLQRRFRARPDSDWKVSGQKGYLTDLIPVDALWVEVWRSPIPHGRITAIDTSEAAKVPGVARIATARDVPGLNAYGPKVRDQPVLCADRVRMVGDPVVAIAASTQAAARLAIRAVRVEIEQLPIVCDVMAALQPEAIGIHDEGNICHERRYISGDAADALARSAVCITETYRTGRQFHAAMETEGGFVVPQENGSLRVHVASHFPHGDRRSLAAILNIEPDRIEVVSSPMGGSFGGKDTLSVQPILVLLAHLTGKTVATHRTRQESLQCGETRHPFVIHMTTGCDAEGHLTGHQVTIIADAGAYTTKSIDVLDTAFENGSGPYAFEAVDMTGRAVFTNNGNSGAFRGFGAVQVQFALEQQMDRLARRVGLDEAEFRLRNLRSLSVGPLGQVTTGAQHPSTVLSVVAQHEIWKQRAVRSKDDRYLRGVGLSLITKGEGFSKGGPNGAALSLSLGEGGRITVACSAVEMGQGAIAAAADITAEVLGVARCDVAVALGSSSEPDAGPSAASRVTGTLYRGIRAAAPDFKKKLLEMSSQNLDLKIENLRLGPGGIWPSRPDANGSILSFSELAQQKPHRWPSIEVYVPGVETPSDVKGHGDFNAASAVAQVSIDRWSCQVRIERMAVAAACGPVVSPMSFVGQVEGGAMMGFGMAVLESVPEREGRYLHQNLDGYMVGTIADAPMIEVLAIEDLEMDDDLGPRGIGEISINVAVPAIANAIANALGCAVRKIPVRPSDVMSALRRKQDP